ncbi:hypothetical protein AZI86_13030 [Bdellovibrio bacteriovorus]|uniref:Uncharacterized protein n=1 Tax=Bdellovibrio bacteriovorus TaxID=959 RepID=A0A150WJ46_BDEBC|nr:hypothetical protein [Bdellovibrio bacteriovorus]KYG63742.1 hypothetical protein AZI86_13030 [Bdellovibrio bacteriovorus]
MMSPTSKSTFMVFVLLFASMVKAEEKMPSCATDGEVAAIMKFLTLQSSDEITTQRGVSDCSRESAVGPALGGIAFMSKFDPLPSLKRSIDQNIIGPSPTRFFLSRAKTIQFVGEYEGECRQDVNGGYVAGYVSPPNPTVYVCRKSSELDAFDMASVFLHEARHVEGYGHATCLRGIFRGLKGCDERYGDKGSYAVETEYYLRLSLHPNISPALKASTRFMGIAELWGRFNKYPIDIRGRLILQEKSSAIYILDNNKVTVNSSQGDAVLVKMNDTHAFIDQQNKTVKSFFAGQWSDTLGVLAQDLREGKLDVGADKIIDMFYGDAYSCVLTNRKLICKANTSGAYASTEIRNMNPVGFIYVSSTKLVQSKTPYVVGQDGYLYRMPLDYETLKSQGESSFTKTKQKYPYKKIVTVPAVPGEFVLTIEGQVLHTPGGSKNLKPVKELEGKIFRSIAPVDLWSEELNDFL